MDELESGVDSSCRLVATRAVGRGEHGGAAARSGSGTRWRVARRRRQEAGRRARRRRKQAGRRDRRGWCGCRLLSNVPGSGSFGLYLFSFCDFDTKFEEREQLEAKTTT